MALRELLRRTLLVPLLLVLSVVQPTLAAGSARSEADWVGSWAAAPQPPFAGKPELYANQSLRLIIHGSAGGSALRLRVSNLYGKTPLVIGAVHVARRTAGAAIDPSSDHAVTFGGQAEITIPPHADRFSDPVDLAVPPLADLAVSLFLPRATEATTTHMLAKQTSYAAAGDLTAAADFPTDRKIGAWPFLVGLEVAAPGGWTLVVFGDSHVDGDGSTKDANHRWPDLLAARLQAAGGAPVGVVNEGLIGNRLLAGSPPEARAEVGDAFGEAGVARFDRDALRHPHARVIILRFGVNDIAFPGVFGPAEPMLERALPAGFRRLVARARQSCIKVVGTTLSPFEDATIAPGYYTPDKERLRQRVNTWIRNSGAFDGVIDFDAVLKDPDHPARLLPRYDSGDHLHPNDAGYAAVADAVPLALLAPR